MPIVDIEIVLKADEVIKADMAAGLADELGEIFGSPPAGTWVRLHGLPAAQYAESGGRREGVCPVFVTVVKSRLPTPDEMQVEVERITGAVAQICNRPSGSVHVLYEPEARGRVAFGAKIVS